MSKDQIKEIEYSRGVFWKDKVVQITFLFLLVFLVASWVLWVVMYRQLNVVMGVPEYFNFLQFNQMVYKYALPIFGSIVAFFHLLIAFFAYSRERLVSYFLIGGAAFLEVLILITVIYYMAFV
ncbi:hypothetical protein KJ855_02435 [Patescibacteria group bacterium]|nr:hypothetical protein [Patescibacteria group bacterium]